MQEWLSNIKHGENSEINTEFMKFDIPRRSFDGIGAFQRR
jgi:hypothetical protein